MKASVEFLCCNFKVTIDKNRQIKSNRENKQNNKTNAWLMYVCVCMYENYIGQ